MRVSLLAVLANDTAIVELVLSEVPLWVVVAVDVDLGEGIVGSWFLHSLVDTGLQQRQEQLQPKGEGEGEDKVC